MADREKLIELLIQADDMCLGTSCPKCEYYRQPECRYKLFADHLIDNSETVRECGRWEDVRGIPSVNRKNVPIVKCSKCEIYFCDLINNHHYMYHFCPNCGAKMDGDGNG